MNVLIIGAGAVGLGVTTFLSKSGAHIFLLARPDVATLINAHGIRCTGLFGEHHVPPSSIQAHSQLKSLAHNPFDYILVCTKSYDSTTISQQLEDCSDLLHQQVPVVLFQNGWGSAEIFMKRLPRHPIFNARVITGFYKPTGNSVHITVHADTIHIGSIFENDISPIAPLCLALDNGGLPCCALTNIAKDLWAKLLYNCALNSLGAITNSHLGGLAESFYTKNIIDNIIREAFLVMHALGFETHWPTSEEYLKAFYSSMIPPTFHHESSTLQDIRSKRRTESDFLNGAIVLNGERMGIDTPTNRTVYYILKFIEEQHSTITETRVDYAIAPAATPEKKALV